MAAPARTIFRFPNPGQALKGARPLMLLESFSELSKLVEPVEALLGAYESDDGAPVVAWLDSSDTFETLKANTRKVAGYYALPRSAALEIAPELASVPGFLPADDAPNAPPSGRKRAAPRKQQSASNADENIEQTSADDSVRWPAIEEELKLFHSTSTALKRAGALQQAVEPALLLIVFADQGSTSGEVYWIGDFLIRELQRNGGARYQQARANYFTERTRPTDDDKNEQPSVSQPLWNCLLASRDIAEATTGRDEIHARHVIATLLRSSDQGVSDLLNAMGVDAPSVCERMVNHVVSWGDDDPEWEQLLAPSAPRQRLIAYEADDPKGEDLIGISREVIALATLISARDIRPPLSIGLFGDWGSGKTFFMRQMRTAVSALSKEARDAKAMQKDLPFYKRIVQIEFNAWHYVEGNLWASLVEHIFSNLKIGDDDEDTVTRSLQEGLLAKIGFHNAALVAATEQEKLAAEAVETAQRELTEAETRRDNKRKELTDLKARNIKRLFDLPSIQEKLQPLAAALGLGPVSTAATDIDHALKRAQAVLQQGGGVLTPLIHAQDRALRWAKLAAAVLVPAALGLLVAWLVRTINWAPIATAFGTLAAVGGTLTRWLNRQTQWVNQNLRTVQSIQQEYDTQLASLMQENDEAVTNLQQQLRDLSALRDSKLQDKVQAQKALEIVKAELTSATSARLLANFIVDRAESSDYRKHLGLLALVRDDFEKLSGLIDDENWKLAPALPGDKPRAGLTKFATLDEELKEADSRINRIVLYIDDLDRCPPNKVVEVLQAVHLLLAFPLFVVVVGVDARWVKRSLRTRYKELLHSAADREEEEELELIGRATADDYLEKIFQVPFWLEPMDANGVRRMVSGLLRSSIQRKNAEEKNGQRGNGQGGVSGANGGSDSREEQRAGDGQQGSTTGSGDQGHNVGDSRTGDENVERPAANIESLEIQSVELQFMNELAPLLGRSPRALKRFVNVYRLVKAELTNAEFGAFLDEQHNTYRVALFLLAVDTGTPLALPQMYGAIMQQRAQPADDSANWLISALELAGTSEDASRFDEERRRLRDWVFTRRNEPYLVNAEVLARWAERIARYSFGAHTLQLPRGPALQLEVHTEEHDE